jgi:flagellar hook-associated protein 2
LTSAIASDPEAIMELFTQQATSKTSTGTSLAGTTVVRTLNSKELSTRYKEEGIGYRFYDILQKNISSIRDSAGNKGTLLEKAGAEKDASETDNTLTTLIEKYEEELEDEEGRIDEYQSKLYTKYSTLETYINKMNSQLSSLTSLTSS